MQRTNKLILVAILTILIIAMINNVTNTNHKLSALTYSTTPLPNSVTPWEPPSLLQLYREYDEAHLFDHWEEYAPHYDVHLRKLFEKIPETKEFRMLEIGVQSGGSVRVWKNYFSDRKFYYVGMDIDPACKRSEVPSENIFVEIGDQSDPRTLKKICREHGPFDFIVDDGGHKYEQIKASLDTLFPSDECLNHDSLYGIEDLHVMAMGEHYSQNPGDVPSLPGYVFKKMHYHWYKQYNASQDESDKVWADRIGSLNLYNSMMFIERGNGEGMLTRITKGDDRIP